MPYCAVPGCVHGSTTVAGGVKWFTFPKDQARTNQWWQSIKREGKINDVKDPRVCSAHFAEHDFERDLKFEMLNPGVTVPVAKLKLTPTACPSKNIPTSHPPSEGPPRHASIARVQKRQATEILDGLEGADQGDQGCATCTELRAKIFELEQELQELRRQVAERDAQAPPASGASSSGMLSKHQVNILLTGQRQRQWDPDSMFMALNVRVNTSRKVYDWLRGEGLPLPSLTSLQRWLAGFKMEPNSTETTQRLLEKLLANMSLRDRHCNVMFDEMNVTNIACYDQQCDQIVGPHGHLQLFLACGLFAHWRMPVLFAFDQPATSDLLKRAITAVEAAGGRVVSVVSDMGGANMGLWRQLNIGHNADVSFANPADPQRRIWVMADQPHALKNLRNHVLDKGITTSSGERIDRPLIRKLLQIDGGAEMRLLHKLHPTTHVEVAGQGRQRVRPAVQLLSATSALAMERYLGRAEVARFLRIVDNGFDALNAGHPGDIKPLRRGYSGTPDQEEALTAFQTEIEGLRVGAAQHLLPFQRGLLVDVRAVRGLLGDLREVLGADVFVLTRRLSQDRIEGTFGLLRVGCGSSTNPTPTDAKSRLRLLSLLMLVRRGINPLLDSDAETPDVSDGKTAEQLRQLMVEEEAGHHNEPDADHEVVSDAVEELSAADHDYCARPTAEECAVDLETGVTASVSAMAHVAGYVARQCGPSVGQPSERAEDEPVEALWTRLLSMGGLTLPTTDFLREFRELEREFCAHHTTYPDKLSREPRVTRELTAKLLNKHPLLPAKVVRRFVRTRTFIRLRHVNRSKRHEAAQKREQRKRKSFAQ